MKLQHTKFTFIEIIMIFIIILGINSILSVKLSQQQQQYRNERPIIGILTQELSRYLEKVYSDNNHQYNSYIAASYVKFIESGGARVVPIWIGQNNSYYENILGKINGVVFPGGSTYFNQSNGYADAGIIIYKIAKKMNDNKDYFPIWGICLGFELLTYAAAGEIEHRSHCSSWNQPLPLKFQPDFEKSKMFCDASREIVDILRNENVTINFHKYCITKKDLKRVNIDNMFRISSHSKDRNGLKFISSLEHVNYPFYGLQFHPEKNNFEWAPRFKIPHTLNATRISQFFSNKIVEEARKNHHQFKSAREEENYLIYNYEIKYTSVFPTTGHGPTNSSFEQCYLFNNN